MREYSDTIKNKISFIIDEDADRPESFNKSKLIIEEKYPNLQVLEYYPPFWESGKFLFIIDKIEVELFFTSFFGGTEIKVDNNVSEENKNKVRVLAKEIFDKINKND